MCFFFILKTVSSKQFSLIVFRCGFLVVDFLVPLFPKDFGIGSLFTSQSLGTTSTQNKSKSSYNMQYNLLKKISFAKLKLK